MGVAALSPINDKLLHGAKVGNLIDVTTCLADSKVNLECMDENKYTPLFWACMNGHKEMAEYLVSLCSDYELVIENDKIIFFIFLKAYLTQS